MDEHRGPTSFQLYAALGGTLGLLIAGFPWSLPILIVLWIVLLLVWFGGD